MVCTEAVEKADGSRGGNVLRWEGRDLRVRLDTALRVKKPDDDTLKARETVKERNYCLHMSSLPFGGFLCFAFFFF